MRNWRFLWHRLAYKTHVSALFCASVILSVTIHQGKNLQSSQCFLNSNTVLMQDYLSHLFVFTEAADGLFSLLSNIIIPKADGMLFFHLVFDKELNFIKYAKGISISAKEKV